MSIATTIETATAGLVVEVPEAFTHVDNSFETASWHDVLEIQPGTYPVEWVNINGKPWNPSPDAVTPGYLANTGPYYARVRLSAVVRHRHREARLLGETRSHDTDPDEPTTYTLNVYAYSASDGSTALSTRVDDRNVPAAFFRTVSGGSDD